MTTHSSSDIRVNRDEEHLRLLARYHWLVCILYFLMLILTALIPLWQHQLSLNRQVSPQHSVNGAFLLGRLIILSLYVLFTGMNAWCLQRHKAWLACCLLSIYECSSLILILDPLGIILGISAILKLRTDSVKEIFHRTKNAHTKP